MAILIASDLSGRFIAYIGRGLSATLPVPAFSLVFLLPMFGLIGLQFIWANQAKQKCIEEEQVRKKLIKETVKRVAKYSFQKKIIDFLNNLIEKFSNENIDDIKEQVKRTFKYNNDGAYVFFETSVKVRFKDSVDMTEVKKDLNYFSGSYCDTEETLESNYMVSVVDDSNPSNSSVKKLIFERAVTPSLNDIFSPRPGSVGRYRFRSRSISYP